MGKKIIRKRPTKSPVVKALKIERESKYIKVFANESVERFNEVGEMVERKEIKWVKYKIENFIGCHYYIKLKK